MNKNFKVSHNAIAVSDTNKINQVNIPHGSKLLLMARNILIVIVIVDISHALSVDSFLGNTLNHQSVFNIILSTVLLQIIIKI